MFNILKEKSPLIKISQIILFITTNFYLFLISYFYVYSIFFSFSFPD